MFPVSVSDPLYTPIHPYVQKDELLGQWTRVFYSLGFFTNGQGDCVLKQASSLNSSNTEEEIFPVLSLPELRHEATMPMSLCGKQTYFLLWFDQACDISLQSSSFNWFKTWFQSLTYSCKNYTGKPECVGPKVKAGSPKSNIVRGWKYSEVESTWTYT